MSVWKNFFRKSLKIAKQNSILLILTTVVVFGVGYSYSLKNTFYIWLLVVWIIFSLPTWPLITAAIAFLIALPLSVYLQLDTLSDSLSVLLFFILVTILILQVSREYVIGYKIRKYFKKFDKSETITQNLKLPFKNLLRLSDSQKQEKPKTSKIKIKTELSLTYLRLSPVYLKIFNLAFFALVFVLLNQVFSWEEVLVYPEMDLDNSFLGLQSNIFSFLEGFGWNKVFAQEIFWLVIWMYGLLISLFTFKSLFKEGKPGKSNSDIWYSFVSVWFLTLIWVFNPYTFDRFLLGQWQFLLGHFSLILFISSSIYPAKFVGFNKNLMLVLLLVVSFISPLHIIITVFSKLILFLYTWIFEDKQKSLTFSKKQPSKSSLIINPTLQVISFFIAIYFLNTAFIQFNLTANQASSVSSFFTSKVSNWLDFGFYTVGLVGYQNYSFASYSLISIFLSILSGLGFFSLFYFYYLGLTKNNKNNQALVALSFLGSVGSLILILPSLEIPLVSSFLETLLYGLLNAQIGYGYSLIAITYILVLFIGIKSGKQKKIQISILASIAILFVTSWISLVTSVPTSKQFVINDLVDCQDGSDSKVLILPYYNLIQLESEKYQFRANPLVGSNCSWLDYSQSVFFDSSQNLSPDSLEADLIRAWVTKLESPESPDIWTEIEETLAKEKIEKLILLKQTNHQEFSKLIKLLTESLSESITYSDDQIVVIQLR